MKYCSARVHDKRNFPGFSWQVSQWLPVQSRGRRFNVQAPRLPTYGTGSLARKLTNSEALGTRAMLRPRRSPRYITALNETRGALPGARFGTNLPSWPCLLKKAHQSSNWKLNKRGGLAWFRLEIRAVDLQVEHQPWRVSGNV